MATKDSDTGAGGRKPTDNTGRNRNASCSFCRKNYRDVGPLVEGPGEVYICGECVELCESIIDQERSRRRSADVGPSAAKSEAIRKRFAPLVPGHDEAREALVLAALRHYQASGPAEQQPILLVGPSHGSRLFLARALAHALESPFAEAEANTLSGSGIAQIEPLLHKLLLACDFDREKAQRGIIYVDGMEDQRFQEWLLRQWEKPDENALAQRLGIEVDRLFFLCGGQSARLDEVVARLGEYPEQPQIRDALLAFGMVPDLARRLARIVKVAPLDEETVAQLVSRADLGQVASLDYARRQ
jgi:ATP-dependent Clp protease ATP-binding subunit ClpX